MAVNISCFAVSRVVRDGPCVLRGTCGMRVGIHNQLSATVWTVGGLRLIAVDYHTMMILLDSNFAEFFNKLHVSIHTLI